ncbi:MAG: hypothetical protein JWM91_85 [Rhodospirillales bacterium]|nr:hypothetical protein [Rhodospirillales bacterium]
MTWTINVYDPRQPTPIFIDLLNTFDDVLVCIARIAEAFGKREYSLSFDVPEEAAPEELDRLKRHGAVRVELAEVR